MKRQILMIAVTALVLPAFSQTNEMKRGEGDHDGKIEGIEHQERKRGERNDRKGEQNDRKSRDRYREMSPEEKAERQERRLKLMEKTLDELGITEEQRVKIGDLQKKLRTDMEQALKKSSEARRKLSQLEDQNASEEEIFAAIEDIAAASAEQMKLIARNKMSMKVVLGPEKYRQFMELARGAYKTHGQRGGDRMPPRPKSPSPPLPSPPIPSTSSTMENPPPLPI